MQLVSSRNSGSIGVFCVFVLKTEFGEDFFLRFAHLFAVGKSGEMQASMREQMRNARAFRDSERARLALRFPHIQKNLALVFKKRERKHIRSVIFFSVCAIYAARERVAGKHEREDILSPQNLASDFLKRNVDGRPASAP